MWSYSIHEPLLIAICIFLAVLALAVIEAALVLREGLR